MQSTQFTNSYADNNWEGFHIVIIVFINVSEIVLPWSNAVNSIPPH